MTKEYIIKAAETYAIDLLKSSGGFNEHYEEATELMTDFVNGIVWALEEAGLSVPEGLFDDNGMVQPSHT